MITLIVIIVFVWAIIRVVQFVTPDIGLSKPPS